MKVVSLSLETAFAGKVTPEADDDTAMPDGSEERSESAEVIAAHRLRLITYVVARVVP